MWVKNARRGFSRSTIARACARDKVGGVGFGTKGVDDEDVQPCEQGNAGFRNFADVRNVGSIAKAESQYRQIAVQHRHRGKSQAPQIKRPFDHMRIEFAHAAIGVIPLENIGERGAKRRHAAGLGINRDAASSAGNRTRAYHQAP